MEGFKNLEVLEKYTQKYHRFKENDVVKIADEDKMYVYKKDKWVPLEINSNLEMTLYELNKQAVLQLEPLTDEQWDSFFKTMNKWQEKINSNYYMLLCKELSYYTVFEKDFFAIESLGIAVEACLKNLGQLVSYEEKEDGAIEFWIKQNDEAYCLYLFDYSNGIEKFN